MNANSTAESENHVYRWHGVALVLIMALALALRLYRLADQSIWLDEYLTVCNLSAPDAISHHALARILFPDQSAGPLYYVMQYFYSSLFGNSPPILRLLSVTISFLCIPAVYLLGKRLYESRVGLIAALCLALSPQHIWRGQEVRAYELVTLLIIMSSYGLFQALHTNRRGWWALHFAANTLLPWVHCLSVIFLPVQGFVLLFIYRRRLRRAVAWTGIQWLLLAPWALWMLGMPYFATDQASYEMPGLEIAKNILTGEIVAHNITLMPAWKTNLSGGTFLSPLLRCNMIFNVLLLLVLVMAIVWIAVQAVRPAYGWLRRRAGDSVEPVRGARAVFLLLLIILPGLTLGLAEKVIHIEILQPQYSMYNVIAYYIVIGAAISALRYRVLRVLGVASMVLLLGYQLAIFLPGTTRVDWHGGAQHIQANGKDGDLVIDLEVCVYPGHYLEYYLKDKPYSVLRLTTFQAACDKSAAFFDQVERAAGGGEDAHSVWMVLELFPLVWSYPNLADENLLTCIERTRAELLRLFEKGFSSRGLAFSVVEIPGHWNLMILRIRPLGNLPLHSPSGPVEWLADVDYGRLLEEIGATSPDPKAQEARIEALRNTIALWPPRGSIGRVLQSVDLLADGHPDIAEAMARDTAQRIPKYGLAHFAMGLALSAQGKEAEAKVSLDKALSMNWGLRYMYNPFVSLLYRQDYAALQAEELRLEQMGWNLFLPALRAVCAAKQSDAKQ